MVSLLAEGLGAHPWSGWSKKGGLDFLGRVQTDLRDAMR
jgi:hypothetical protein